MRGWIQFILMLSLALTFSAREVRAESSSEFPRILYYEELMRLQPAKREAYLVGLRKMLVELARLPQPNLKGLVAEDESQTSRDRLVALIESLLGEPAWAQLPDTFRRTPEEERLARARRNLEQQQTEYQSNYYFSFTAAARQKQKLIEQAREELRLAEDAARQAASYEKTRQEAVQSQRSAEAKRAAQEEVERAAKLKVEKLKAESERATAAAAAQHSEETAEAQRKAREEEARANAAAEVEKKKTEAAAGAARAQTEAADRALSGADPKAKQEAADRAADAAETRKGEERLRVSKENTERERLEKEKQERERIEKEKAAAAPAASGPKGCAPAPVPSCTDYTARTGTKEEIQKNQEEHRKLKERMNKDPELSKHLKTCVVGGHVSKYRGARGSKGACQEIYEYCLEGEGKCKGKGAKMLRCQGKGLAMCSPRLFGTKKGTQDPICKPPGSDFSAACDKEVTDNGSSFDFMKPDAPGAAATKDLWNKEVVYGYQKLCVGDRTTSEESRKAILNLNCGACKVMARRIPELNRQATNKCELEHEPDNSPLPPQRPGRSAQ